MMELLEIPLHEIERDPHQPRKTFDEAALQELAASIKEHGILQPVLVRTGSGTQGKKWVLVAGERRLRASEIAGLASLPAFVADDKVQDTTSGTPRADAGRVLLLQITENLQREDITEDELVSSLLLLMDRDTFGMTQADLAKHLGCSKATISKLLRTRDADAQDDKRVCRPTKFGAVANTLSAFQGLLSSAKRVMKLHHDSTGYLYTEQDCNKVRLYAMVPGSQLSEANIEEILGMPLTLLQERESNSRLENTRKEAAAATPIAVQPARVPVPVPAPVRRRAPVDVDVDIEEMQDIFSNAMMNTNIGSMDTGFSLPAQQPWQSSSDQDSVESDDDFPFVQLIVGRKPLTLSGSQFKTLLTRLGANAQCSPAHAEQELVKALLRLN